MRRAGFLARLLADQSGISITEFAIVGPAALMMMVGGMYVSMLGFTASSLRYATEAAARCASVNSVLCSDAATTQDYAMTHFKNLSGSTATFTASTQVCGSQVTGAITYTLKAATYSLTIPLTARSCFP